MDDPSTISVLVDALACKPGQSGILSHGIGIVRGMSRAADLSVTVLTSAPGEFADLPGVAVRTAPARTRSFLQRTAWREVALPRLVAESGIEVVVSSVPELPFRRLRVPAVMVVHDLAAVVAPALYPRSKRLRYELLLRGACTRATRIVCVSNATLLDLHRWAGVDPERCSVIGNAPQALGGDGVRSTATEPYVLLVGNVYGNKNTTTLLRAMAAVKIAAARAGSPVPRLIMVGPLPRAAAERLSTDLWAAGVQDIVEHRGFVDGDTLGSLYRGAAALVYPSLYEGQGIPVMEATSAGIPVIASDLPPIREFAGEGVTLIDRPLDPDAWASAIAAGASAQLSASPRERSDPEKAWDAVGRDYAALLRPLTGPRRP